MRRLEALFALIATGCGGGSATRSPFWCVGGPLGGYCWRSQPDCTHDAKWKGEPCTASDQAWCMVRAGLESCYTTSDNCERGVRDAVERGESVTEGCYEVGGGALSAEPTTSAFWCAETRDDNLFFWSTCYRDAMECGLSHNEECEAPSEVWCLTFTSTESGEEPVEHCLWSLADCDLAEAKLGRAGLVVVQGCTQAL